VHVRGLSQTNSRTLRVMRRVTCGHWSSTYDCRETVLKFDNHRCSFVQGGAGSYSQRHPVSTARSAPQPVQQGAPPFRGPIALTFEPTFGSRRSRGCAHQSSTPAHRRQACCSAACTAAQCPPRINRNHKQQLTLNNFHNQHRSYQFLVRRAALLSNAKVT
jgi:hypothetical protein